LKPKPFQLHSSLDLELSFLSTNLKKKLDKAGPAPKLRQEIIRSRKFTQKIQFRPEFDTFSSGREKKSRLNGPTTNQTSLNKLGSPTPQK
jgi:hypothetical protein